jgi:hypothetical protein
MYIDRISVERKSDNILEHILSRQFDTIERGATYAIIAYDTQDNLPQRTMIAREKMY